MKPHHKILSTPGFILCLILLLLNDWVFKDLFHNWATGKLSDFAGMFVFPLFWVALFPRLAKHAFWASALWFVYWKSPYSQFLIDGWNGLGLYGIHRVADLTDLLALVMVPLAYKYWMGAPRVVPFRLHPVVPLGVAAFAFMATSHVDEFYPKDEYMYDATKDSVKAWLTGLEEIDLKNIDYSKDTIKASINVPFTNGSRQDNFEMGLSIFEFNGNGNLTLLRLDKIRVTNIYTDSAKVWALEAFAAKVAIPLSEKNDAQY